MATRPTLLARARPAPVATYDEVAAPEAPKVSEENFDRDGCQLLLDDELAKLEELKLNPANSWLIEMSEARVASLQATLKNQE